MVVGFLCCRLSGNCGSSKWLWLGDCTGAGGRFGDLGWDWLWPGHWCFTRCCNSSGWVTEGKQRCPYDHALPAPIGVHQANLRAHHGKSRSQIIFSAKNPKLLAVLFAWGTYQLNMLQRTTHCGQVYAYPILLSMVLQFWYHPYLSLGSDWKYYSIFLKLGNCGVQSSKSYDFHGYFLHWVDACGLTCVDYFFLLAYCGWWSLCSLWKVSRIIYSGMQEAGRITKTGDMSLATQLEAGGYNAVKGTSTWVFLQLVTSDSVEGISEGEAGAFLLILIWLLLHLVLTEFLLESLSSSLHLLQMSELHLRISE